MQEAFFLRTIRDYVPELAGIEPDALVKHANALCTARGQALKEQLQKTREELKLDKNQMTKLTAQALIRCRPELAR
ncbi:hypothetical protein ADK86_27380 [Streptomyces sp. NRRL F-5755]|nr:hypothetical protein ADK86_27380 [Streptomyces sp. NRRL F-5755]